MITYLAVPFDRGNDGSLVHGAARVAPDAAAAELWAKDMASRHIGAIAFARTIDDDTGADQEGELIAAFGEVDDGLLVR